MQEVKELFVSGKGIKKWCAFYLILLFTLALPFINFLTISFIMVPAVILYVKLNLKSFTAYYVGIHAAAFVLVSLLFGDILLGLLPVVMSLFFLVPAVVIGYLYKRKSAAKMVLTGGVLALLSELLLLLIILTAAGININASIELSIRQSIAIIPELSKAMPANYLDQLIQMSKRAIPLFIIFFSFYYVGVTHGIARKTLNKTGETIPGFGPIKEWKLPKSFVWCYFIALTLSFFTNADAQSGLYVILLNLLPLLMFAFAIQAISFLFFIADAKRWNKALPIAGIIVCPFIPNILGLLGILDIAFDIRKRFKPQ